MVVINALVQKVGVVVSASYFHPIPIFAGKAKWELNSRVEEHERLHSGRLQPCPQITIKLAVANAQAYRALALITTVKRLAQHQLSVQCQ